MAGPDLWAVLGFDGAGLLPFCRSVLGLFEVLTLNHNWFSNTQQAAIFEAQGGQFIKSNSQAFDHYNALVGGLNNLRNVEERVLDSGLDLQRGNRAIGNAVLDIVKPLLTYSRNIRATGSETIRICDGLRTAAPSRFAAVALETGERGEGSSVIQQLANKAVQLRSQGIDPSLIVNPSSAARATLNEIESLPSDEQEAIVKITPVLAAMRLTLRNMIGAYATRISAGLMRCLTIIDDLLTYVAINLGSKLTTFILIPRSVLQHMMQMIGVSEYEA